MMFKKNRIMWTFLCVFHASCYSADSAYAFCKKMLNTCMVLHILDYVPTPSVVIWSVISLCVNKEKKQQLVANYQLPLIKKSKESIFKRRKIDAIDSISFFSVKCENLEDIYTPTPLVIPLSDYPARPALLYVNGKVLRHVLVSDGTHEFLQTMQTDY